MSTTEKLLGYGTLPYFVFMTETELNFKGLEDQPASSFFGFLETFSRKRKIIITVCS